MTPLWHTTPCIRSLTHTLDHIHRVYYENKRPHKHSSHSSLRNPGAVGSNWPAPAQPAESAHWSRPQQSLVWAWGPLAYTEQVFTIKQELLARTKTIFTQTELHQHSQSKDTLQSSAGFETLQSLSSKVKKKMI